VRWERGQLTRRSAWFGGEWKAETPRVAPHRSRPSRGKRPGGAWAPHRRGSSAGFGRQHSLAHQASARLEHVGGRRPPLFLVAEGQVPGADRASPEITCRPPQGPDIGVCRLKTVPGMEVPSGPNAARAWNRPHFSGRAPRWLL